MNVPTCFPKVILLAWLSLACGCGGSSNSPGADSPNAEKSPRSATNAAESESSKIAADEEDEYIAPSSKKPAGAGEERLFSVPESTATLVETKTLVENYPDGAEKVRREVKVFSDDSIVNDGEYVSYYPDKKTFTKGAFADGESVGPWEYWHPNGKLCRKVNFKAGKLDGAWEVFREDGTREYARSYAEGKRHGKWVYYDKTGEAIVRVENYFENLPDGEWVHFYENGQKAIEEHYDKGRRDGSLTAWHKNGKKMAEESYRDGELHGWRRAWDEEGTLIFEAEFDEGHPVSNSNADSNDEKKE